MGKNWYLCGHSGGRDTNHRYAQEQRHAGAAAKRLPATELRIGSAAQTRPERSHEFSPDCDEQPGLFVWNGPECRVAHATIGNQKPSKKCWLNGGETPYRRFVRPSSMAYTECFAVSSNC